MSPRRLATELMGACASQPGLTPELLALVREAAKQLQTQGRKVEVYERLLHHLQGQIQVAMDPARVDAALQLICAWSYAHRCGNGALDNAAEIAHAFERIAQHLKMPTA